MNLILTADLTLLFSALSILSGVGSYLQGVREKRLAGGSRDFLTEIILALIAGLAFAYLGHSQEWNEAMTCFLVLMVSNNGAETIAIIRKALKQSIQKRFGLTSPKGNGA